MTAIIGIKRKNKIVICSDSSATNSYYKSVYSSDLHQKIHKINGSNHCLIACSGACNAIFRSSCLKNLLDCKDDVDFNFIVSNVVPKLFGATKEIGAIKYDEYYNTYSLGFSSILATKNHLFKIDAFGAVTEINDCVSIGSGSIILSAKYLMIKKRKISINKMCVMCMESAIKNGANIGHPIILSDNINTKNLIINKGEKYE